MRVLSTLTREEALTIVAKVMAIAYLDETSNRSLLNPDRELVGAQVVDGLLEVLDKHDLRPESTCSADMLRPHLRP